jgi:hypothetical protein
LKTLAFGLCQQLLTQILPNQLEEVVPLDAAIDLAGRAKGVLELKGIQRAKAAISDDATADLSYWAMPNETKAQTEARARLRRVAHRWLVMN